MSVPLSVCIIARDEEERLPRCLDAVAFADEIVVVVDDRSVDGTEKLARERAQRVDVRPYEGDVAQKRHCAGLATHDWILMVDPDEVLTAEAAGDLLERLDRASERVAGFEVNRVTWHLGRWIRHGDFYPDWKLRAFRRSRARWVGSDPHARIEVDGTVERLTGELEHFSYRDLADQVARIQFFSEQSARSLAQRGRKVRLSDLVLRPPARFLRAYVQKRGFLDGVPGLIIAAATSFHVFLKYAKLWEREHLGSPQSRP
jgi:glycosyltransferase involved in cell wall biosynthesis